MAAKKKRKVYTPEAKAKAIKLYKDGETLENIGRKCKIGNPTLIYSWLNAAGVAKRGKGTSAKPSSTKKKTGAKRKKGNQPQTKIDDPIVVSSEHIREANRILEEAQVEFRNLIGSSAEADDFEGVTFFNEFASQLLTFRQQLKHSL